MNSFEVILNRDGKLVYKTRGVSMRPMLRENRDIVAISAPDRPLKRYDVALYRRGSDYVLHRVIRVTDRYYLIRGDNTYATEKVPTDAVIGVLTDFKRKGKTYSVYDIRYRCYCRIWCWSYPLRRLLIKIRRKLKKTAIPRELRKTGKKGTGGSRTGFKR